MPWIPAAVSAVGAVGAGVSALGDGEQGADDVAQQKIWDQEQADRDQKRDNDFQYGGKVGGADEASLRYKNLGANAGNQSWTQPDYANADQSRGSQRDALGLMQGAANGTAPSQAAIMMKQGNDQAAANSLAMAAGARGPAAMAMAQQNALGANSAAATNNINNMGAMRANEMATARGQYGQMSSGMRGQDQSQAQYGSDLELRRRALMQQGQMGYEQMGANVNEAQLQARMANQGANDAHWKAQMDADQQGKKNTQDLVMGGVNAAASLGGAAITKSDVRVKDGVVLEGIAALKKPRKAARSR